MDAVGLPEGDGLIDFPELRFVHLIPSRWIRGVQHRYDIGRRAKLNPILHQCEVGFAEGGAGPDFGASNSPAG